ncbi:diaminopimelate decarboxylase [Actinoplanes lobatus]|uniref:Diaminopimelate decarboxylase n=1 Tax=Actinoplanes lobatus TaxID=113568 RepID=A0A7W7MIT5_9ACTN|nr:Y4yA family PLP-dependent enzyme [Actinoplanes lobatus]MBB4751335.1 diaminopimelate decarboxylase [Actinoplanes lobatus]GGN63561.1 diaminopimelate decarboxylase [Actinoplanes lobatus]GIE40944.1 diaminopimelate decarboxylase [Actinoplanes lobatus]
MAPYLQPRVDGDLRSILDSHDTLHRMLDTLGSPLNLVLPDRLAANVRDFEITLRAYDLGGTVYFAHKANRSSALVRALATTGAGIDVASLGELQHALGAGIGPDRIMATGPKSREFLWLAARTGVTVGADSVPELAELAGIVAAHGLPRVRVMARLSGFASTGTTVLSRASRFGVPVSDLDPLWTVLDKHRDQLDFHGAAYHLDTNGLPEKAAALEGCLEAMAEAQRRGLSPRAVDVGGGFGVNYLADSREWETWTTQLTGAVLGQRPPITWDGHGYGLRNEGGRLRGALAVYPAYRAVAGPAYLDRLLATASAAHRRPLGSLVLDNLYDLHLEPGRALLDQCGAVLTRVEEVRDGLVRVAANSNDVGLEAHGVLMDPILVPRGEPRPDDGPVEVFLAGNLCLEADLITRRRVLLPRPPRAGDLLVFANTAGYLMDFSAGSALMQPTARTVAAWRHGGDWRWCLDERYWPVTGREETG